ncbi:MAG: tRNA preQ1(34) S-adenosylmethionine ribosyltransferase-isomerase QueA [Deltaproteobacteria bacterium]|nr:tRNA preQ1(34) S-adenosylmethionine ribosyltransferase-isomerase QueA [Deltaproteobacteria bacterium]
MNLDEFDFDLPPERIAQRPLPERGSARLMIVDRAAASPAHSSFERLPEYLRPGDLLVRNDTRVIPARLRGERSGGGAVEVLLLRCERADADGEVWSCLARPARRLRRGGSAELRGGIVATWLDDGAGGAIRSVRLAAPRPVIELLDAVGEVPLPPYIDRAADESDAEAYQTVYARSCGAVAAPTAGLHFTLETIDHLRSREVEIVDLTLHVGPGTFLPVRTARVEDHHMAPERVEVPPATAARIAEAKREGRRVVAVGTTTVRALEAAAAELLAGRGFRGEVSLFIVPGHEFRVVEALITNFHLPRSTLLVLVAAFAGRERILAAYREAVARQYRFYSYGDAMLIV